MRWFAHVELQSFRIPGPFPAIGASLAARQVRRRHRIKVIRATLAK
jgi:hypothetical protein